MRLINLVFDRPLAFTILPESNSIVLHPLRLTLTLAICLNLACEKGAAAPGERFI